jgi:hypothetical protein
MNSQWVQNVQILLTDASCQESCANAASGPPVSGMAANVCHLRRGTLDSCSWEPCKVSRSLKQHKYQVNPINLSNSKLFAMLQCLIHAWALMSISSNFVNALKGFKKKDYSTSSDIIMMEPSTHDSICVNMVGHKNQCQIIKGRENSPFTSFDRNRQIGFAVLTLQSLQRIRKTHLPVGLWQPCQK